MGLDSMDNNENSCPCGLLPMKNKRIEELEGLLFSANALISEMSTLLDDSKYPVTDKELAQVKRILNHYNG